MTIVVTKSEIKLIKDILGMNLEAYQRYCESVCTGLQMDESIFLNKLGTALLIAFSQNQHKDAIRILQGWQRECSQASMEYRIWEDKEKASKDS